MHARHAPALLLLALGVMALASGCRSAEGADAKESPTMAVHYLEIVSDDADALVTLYEGMHGLSFSAPAPEMGQARIARAGHDGLVGIRKPLAAHETPIMRTYVAVPDIAAAVAAAEAAGAMVAYPPTKQGDRGTFAIVIHGGVQHGLWQR